MDQEPCLTEQQARDELALYPVVASVSATILWSPNYAVGSGGVGIVSKYPCRLHVGIRRAVQTTNGRPPVIRGAVFHPETKSFHRWHGEELPSESRRLLEDRVRTLDHSVDFFVLSFFPFLRGLHADAALAAATEAALTVYLAPDEKERAKVAAHLNEMGRAKEFSKVDADLLDRMIALESSLGRGKADGHLILGSIMAIERAVLFHRQPDRPSNSDYDLPRQAFQIDQLCKPDELCAFLPFDVALLYTGDPGTTEGAVLVDRDFRQDVEGSHPIEPPAIVAMARAAGEQPETRLHRSYRDASAAFSLKVLVAFREALSHPNAPNRILTFLRTQDGCHDLLRLMGRSTDRADLAITVLKAAALTCGVDIAVRFMEYGTHGALLVVGRRGQLGKVMQEAMPKLQLLVPAAHLDFPPSAPGEKIEGLTIEHRPLSSTPSVRVLHGGEWKSYHVTAESLEAGQWPEFAPKLLHMVVWHSPSRPTRVLFARDAAGQSFAELLHSGHKGAAESDHSRPALAFMLDRLASAQGDTRDRVEGGKKIKLALGFTSPDMLYKTAGWVRESVKQLGMVLDLSSHYEASVASLHLDRKSSVVIALIVDGAINGLSGFANHSKTHSNFTA